METTSKSSNNNNNNNNNNSNINNFIVNLGCSIVDSSSTSKNDNNNNINDNNFIVNLGCSIVGSPSTSKDDNNIPLSAVILFIFIYAANNRFSGVNLECFIGQIYSLCKDQHGCRFLQKKLEENSQKYVDMIYDEVYEHYVELITGKLINYFVIYTEIY